MSGDLEKVLSVEEFPVLPLRDAVIFPDMSTHLFIGRECSLLALEKSLSDQSDQYLLTLSQKDENIEGNPSEKDLHDLGTLVKVIQTLKLPDKTLRVFIKGIARAKAVKFHKEGALLTAKVEFVDKQPLDADREALEIGEDRLRYDVLKRCIIREFIEYTKGERRIQSEIIEEIKNTKDYSHLTYLVAHNLKISFKACQTILAEKTLIKQMEKVYASLREELDIAKLENKLNESVKEQMEKTQKQYYLNEQLKAIQKELGGGEETAQDEMTILQDKIKSVKMPKEAKQRARAELRKLQSNNPMSAEAGVIRNYLDWLLDLPWDKCSKIDINLPRAKDVLDEDHYGLNKVKERIVEALAVQQRMKNHVGGAVLCLKGPPGVGKTSLAKSIARAVGRKFVKVSLGGIRDEAEIRGHRKTYIGSMPGRIIQAIRKAKVSNPVILLDEIDKVVSDYRGDPSSALLEVLDPEQNKCFSDHYIELEYDLSKVMFVCTANSLNLQKPLLDRLEVISISGYTEEEKLKIARNYLIKKQMKTNGLKEGELTISDSAIRDLIRFYTREAGVRNLEREIASICRKSLIKIISKLDKQKAANKQNKVKKVAIAASVKVTSQNLKSIIGVKKFTHGQVEKKNLIGITNGLAWTEAGGEVLLIEALVSEGKGKSVLTGKLGDIMKESIQAAQSYVRSRAKELGIPAQAFSKKDIHVHVPEGATPKDGPSAGVGMVTSIVSALTNIPVRCDIAMTGEMTLRGRVMAIGGLKEKLLAAKQQNIKKVLIPEDNVKDLEEIDKKILGSMKIIPVTNLSQVLDHALSKKPKPLSRIVSKFENLGSRSEGLGDIPVTH